MKNSSSLMQVLLFTTCIGTVLTWTIQDDISYILSDVPFDQIEYESDGESPQFKSAIETLRKEWEAMESANGTAITKYLGYLKHCGLDFNSWMDYFFNVLSGSTIQQEYLEEPHLGNFPETLLDLIPSKNISAKFCESANFMPTFQNLLACTLNQTGLELYTEALLSKEMEQLMKTASTIGFEVQHFKNFVKDLRNFTAECLLV